MAFECGNHPGADAAWMCVGCEGVFCDDCVVERSFGRGTRVQTCKGCGELCNAVRGGITVDDAPLGASFGSAFGYPLDPHGSLVLLGGTLVITVLRAFGGLGSLFGWCLMLGYGMSVIRSTADGRDTPPYWQDVSTRSDLVKPMLLAVCTTLVSFGPAVFAASEGRQGLALALVVAGALYAPMAWLAASISGNLLAITPITVLPLLLRVNASYWAACAVLLPLIAVGQLGTGMLGGAAPGLVGLAISTALSLYLLMVEMRILGLVWRRNRDELGLE